MANGGRQASSGRRALALLALVGLLVVGSCSGGGSHSSPPSTSHVGSTTPSSTITSTDDGGTAGGTQLALINGIRLSKGQALSDTGHPTPVVDGEPLDDASIRAVTDRLPAWTTDDTLQQPFNWPVETKPAPRAGATVDVAFPLAHQTPPDEVPTGALHVLRVQPEGAVDIAPFVTITFDQPMVPVATVGQLATADVPATITPEVPGVWQWIGTKTLRFDAKSDAVDRLPMATDFTVEVAAGTKSATGGVLESPASFQFSTPAADVRTLTPTGDDLSLTPVFVATFDQLVDAQAVLPTIAVRAGDQQRPVRLATAAEIDADDTARQIVANAPEKRWVAFRPVDPFPADASLTITVGPGIASAEGPITTSAPETYTAHTYRPLHVESFNCSYGDQCPPLSDINISFNNALDAKLFDPATVTIDPPIAGQIVGAYGNVITIHGATQARTTYHVTLPASLTDVHGQQLGATDARDVTIGAAAPILQQFAQPLTTVDPLAGSPSISVFTTNHDDLRVRLFAVTPDDWPAYMQYVTTAVQGGQAGQTLDPPWPLLSDKIVKVDGGADQFAETDVDLSDALGRPHGHIVVLVESTTQYDVNDPNYWSNRPAMTWAQATSIGLDAMVDASTIHAWTTNLGDGTPIGSVQLRLLGSLINGNQNAGTNSSTATTDANGLATLALDDHPSSAIVATAGDDSALLSQSYFGSWQRSVLADDSRWYVFDDRGTYRPGETVSVKGWVRRLTTSSDAQLQLLDGSSVEFSVQDAQGNAIGSGHVPLNAVGGFDFTFDVPKDANLGLATITMVAAGAPGLGNATWTHPVDIQEFRRPEFEVSARAASDGPYLRGAPLTVASDANYYAGGPLGGAPVNWQVTTSAATYAPPGWDGFTFGIWTPWWIDSLRGPSADVIGPCCFPGGPDQSNVEQFTGTTDAGGSNYLQIDVGKLADNLDGLPVTVNAQATITDVNRQAWSSTTNVLVHPAALYVGLRSDRPYVGKGDPLDVDVIVTDVDGKAVTGRSVTVSASRTESVFRNGEWVDEPVDTQTCNVTSAAEGVPCSFSTTVGGTYVIKSTITDDAGRMSRTELTRWVSGADVAPDRAVGQEQLQLIPDLAEYTPGSTAQILVQAPFATGDGILTVARNGILSTDRFEVAQGAAVLHVPIQEGEIPGLDLTVEVVGVTPRTGDDGQPLPDAPPRPAFATGSLTLPISLATRTLTVTATPAADTVAPGADTKLDVTVVDSAGQPVAGSELAVIVADEAVLALSGYSLQDPLQSFYGRLQSYIDGEYGRRSIVLANPLDAAQGDGERNASAETTTAAGTAPASSGDTKASGTVVDQQAAGGATAAPSFEGSTAGPIDVRANFNALAVFAPSVLTDSSGHATVDVPLPDSLTRYRVMVVAAGGTDRFGSAEANITARLPLMVRPSAPRFLNFGDTFDLPVVVQNQTDAAMQVDVVVQTDNLTLTAGAGRRVTVPANDRVEVRFPASAVQAGTARFRVAAAGGDFADASTIDLPVYTPSTAEAFATYGVIDDGATSQPVLAPIDVVPQFGGLDVTTSSTSLQALTDAVIYIAQYPYQTSDALASQIIAIASLRDVLDAFDAPGLPSADQLDATVTDNVAKLVAMQNDDGGFPYWQHGRPSDPFNSTQVTQSLLIARDGGFAVPQSTVDRALAYLGSIEQHIPQHYSQDARDSISAYALDVRMAAGDRDSAKAEALFNSRRADLPLDAIAWLWPVIDDDRTSAEIERILGNRAVDTAGALTFTTVANDDDYVTLRSDRRTDGIVLDSLIAVRPKSDMIPKVVAGLLAAQTNGRWDNVQENSFILLALKHYFDAFESQTPEFVARVWLGDRFAGEHPFVGRSTDRALLSIPTADLIANGDTGLTISKEGAGRLYYRIGLRTAPADLHLDPLDRGFVVARTYSAVDNPSDVTRDADGTWHIAAGARVRVRLTMVAESQRTHVALIDPLPAGLEILNPELATTGDVPTDKPNGDGPPIAGGGAVDTPFTSWPSPMWFDHQNMRDDRAESFATYLAAGSYDYSYVARATTPGNYVVPPTRAEEMYAPETFGRGGTDTVVIAG